MGVLLIVIGLAFALLAVAVVLNRRDAQAQVEAEPEQEPAEAGLEPAVEAQAPAEPIEGDQPESGGVAQAEPAAEEAAGGSPAAKPPAPTPRALLPVAELLREEVTGRLVLRLGDQVIRSAADLRSEADRRKLQYASADLAEWFRGSETPVRPVGAPSRRGKPAEPGPEAAGEAPPGEAQPRNMIEAINAILDRQLAGAQGAVRAVRLLPDPSGGVRVLIGVKSYSLEDVPDEKIREVIRQAVAEWEASQ
jgi:hypothetical protein